MIESNTRVLSKGDGYKKVSSLLNSIAVWDGQTTNDIEITTNSNQETVEVKLINGLRLVVHENQYFPFVRKKGRVQAKDLDDTCLVHLNTTSFDFDYLNLAAFKYLSKLNSFDLGVLLGLFYYLRVDSTSLDIPHTRKEVWKALEYLFKLLEVSYEKEQYYKRADRIRYTINNEAFLEEIKPLLIEEEFPEIFWSSKLLLQGFFKSCFYIFHCINKNVYCTSRKTNYYIERYTASFASIWNQFYLL
jgi:hypothetical protein